MIGDTVLVAGTRIGRVVVAVALAVGAAGAIRSTWSHHALRCDRHGTAADLRSAR